MTAPAGLYPLSTSRGDSIPLDVIKPVALTLLSFSTATSTSCTLPAGTEITALFATEDCIVRLSVDFPEPFVNGTFYSDSLFIPAGTVVSCLLSPGLLYVRGLSSSGSIAIQTVQKWAAVGSEDAYRAK